MTIAKPFLSLLAIGNVMDENSDLCYLFLGIKDRIETMVTESSFTLVFETHRCAGAKDPINLCFPGFGQGRWKNIIGAQADKFICALSKSLSRCFVQGKDGPTGIQ
jgi:hypothetical protein